MSLLPYQDTSNLLQAIPFPDLILLRQRFARPYIPDIARTITATLDESCTQERIQPGMRIAIAVGSRGIANIATIVRALVANLRRYGAEPFIVPAMGSHGGATAEGQREVLISLGVSEEFVGAPIISSLEVEQLGTLPNGLPVHIDQAAHSADGIVVLNRIKPHTDFSAPIESGIAKMVAIGLGKHAGALAVHAWGIEGLTVHLSEVAKFTVARTKILFGLAILENAYDEVAEIVVVPPEGIGNEHERILLERAKSMMPRLPWDMLDVLVIDEMGKNISGAGMDPNIIGRMRWGEQKVTAAQINSIAVLDVTEASHGNAVGLGLADITTARLLEKIDSQAIYINALTAGVIAANSGKIPLVMATDHLAVAAAIRMSGRPDLRHVRLARILNTLKLEYVLASPASLEHLRSGSDIEILGAARPFALANANTLLPFEASRLAYVSEA